LTLPAKADNESKSTPSVW